VPLEETLSALEHAVASGRARYVGISNYNGWQSARAATLTQVRGTTPLVATQVEYSLVQRSAEGEVLDSAAAHGLGVMAWSPLGRRVLTGKYRTGTPADSRGASPDYQRFVAPYLDDRATRVVGSVMTAADGLGVSPLAVALAWVRDQPGVVAPIVGARTSGQLKGSLDADDVILPEEIRAALDDVSTPAVGYPEAGIRR
jgi:aryl-alcohol dehydrogenase-like predicted oxidoreductase